MKRDRLTLLFYLFFRDRADIFNPGFLLSTGVSYGGAVRKNRAHDIISFVPEISKVPLLRAPRVPPQIPSGQSEAHTRSLHSPLGAGHHSAVQRAGLAPNSTW